jgi:hypothetical protein
MEPATHTIGSFKQRLKLTLKSLKKQKAANDVVDEVVLDESTEPLKAREAESQVGTSG